MAAVDRHIPDLTRKLERWLASRVEGGAIISAVTTPKNGVSSETYLIDATTGDAEPARWVLRIEASRFQVYQDAAVERQFHILQALHRAATVPVPRPLWYESDATVLGSPFYVMERIEGVPPPEDYHSEGVLFDAWPAERERMWRDAVCTLARIHKTDPAPFAFLDRSDLGAPGIDQELARWDRYREWTGLLSVSILDRARRWLDDHRPAPTPPGLAWGDARPVNMMFRDARCVGVLDWETASLGGGETDLGWWLFFDHSKSAGVDIPRAKGLGGPAETVALWEQEMGRKAQAIEWHELFATWRFAWIVERAFALFAAGKGAFPGAGAPQNPARHRLAELLALGA